MSDLIEECDGLDLIDMSYCNEVGKFIRTIGKLKKVKTLILDGCNNLCESQIEMKDPKMLKANNIGMKSHTSSSAIVEAIPRALESCLVYLPSSLVCLSLENCRLSNESFPMDFSSLSMLKELSLNHNDIVSLPNCVRTIPRLEKLSIDHCNRLESLEHPPRTLKHLIFGFSYDILEGKVVFDREMSPIIMTNTSIPLRSFIEGIYIVEDMGNVEENVLRSLGWTNLDFTKIQPVETGSKVEMLYEFGIFSTYYRGKEMPNWISDRRDGSSISFTIPSSPYSLRGLNICSMLMQTESRGVSLLADIKISNITKKHTWIYPCVVLSKEVRVGITYLSHWMFGKNEMEDGDQITISIPFISGGHITRECGVSFVYDEYDDGKNKMEEGEDVLGYYKSWNHIIGGDLSIFQTTTPGEYYLIRGQLMGFGPWPEHVERPLFRAFSPSKST